MIYRKALCHRHRHVLMPPDTAPGQCPARRFVACGAIGPPARAIEAYRMLR